MPVPMFLKNKMAALLNEDGCVAGTWVEGVELGASLLYCAATDTVVSRPTVRASTYKSKALTEPADVGVRLESSAVAPVADSTFELSPIKAEVSADIAAMATTTPTPVPLLAPTPPPTSNEDMCCSASIFTVSADTVAELSIAAVVVLSSCRTDTTPFRPRPAPLPDVGATA